MKKRHIPALFPSHWPHIAPYPSRTLKDSMTQIQNYLKIALVAAVTSVSLTGLGIAQTATKTPAAPAQAATNSLAGDDKAVATVNGYEIKTSEVRMAFDDVIGQLPNLPAKLRYPFVVEFLIERHLVAQVAAKEGVADTEDYKRRLAAYQAKALRDSYLAGKLAPAVTDDELKAEYDAEAAKVQQTERVRARHILVATEKEANDIEAKLKAGAKFEDLAKQYSLDGSKDYGGDLGYFTAPEMVAEFSKAAFALKVNEISAPIKSEYGWHVIRLDDRKMGTVPPFDQVKEALRNVKVRDKLQAKLQSLQATAKVELLDPDLKKAHEEYQAQQKAAQDQASKQGAAGAPEDNGKGDLGAPDAPVLPVKK